MILRLVGVVFLSHFVSALPRAPDLDKVKQTLITSYIAGRGLRGSYGEQRLRYRLLNTAQRTAAAHNAQSNRHFNMNLNKFSLMTAAERSAYLGLSSNITRERTVALPVEVTRDKREVSLSSFSQRDQGHVTGVKDQGGCGSCWAFSGVGAFEGAYAIATGITKSFSEKEALDCSYDVNVKDGCSGGWFSAVWRYIKNSGRLAEMQHVPYFPQAGTCKWGAVAPNGIKNADYVAYYKAAQDGVEDVIRRSTPAIAFTVEDDFFAYENGLYDGCPNQKSVNHGVILVGYSPHHWEAKNSWGKDWGEGGFVKFSRAPRENICGILNYVNYPVVVYRDRGEPDQPDVVPDDDLELVSRYAKVYADGGYDVITAVNDGDRTTCFSTKFSSNPSIKMVLDGEVMVQKLTLHIQDKTAMVGSKIHVGTRGSFMDKRVAVLSEDDFQTETDIEIRLSETVSGSHVFLEYYGNDGNSRSLTICEMEVFAKPSGDDTNPDECNAGTVRCNDGVCRHAHMC